MMEHRQYWIKLPDKYLIFNKIIIEINFNKYIGQNMNIRKKNKYSQHQNINQIYNNYYFQIVNSQQNKYQNNCVRIDNIKIKKKGISLTKHNKITFQKLYNDSDLDNILYHSAINTLISLTKNQNQKQTDQNYNPINYHITTSPKSSSINIKSTNKISSVPLVESVNFNTKASLSQQENNLSKFEKNLIDQPRTAEPYESYQKKTKYLRIRQRSQQSRFHCQEKLKLQNLAHIPISKSILIDEVYMKKLLDIKMIN